MKPLLSDTSPEAERILIEGYRRMPIWRKLQQVEELNQFIRQAALAMLRRQYPQADERELRLRLAARWLTPQQMHDAFGWQAT
jgi:hypothetical protein